MASRTERAIFTGLVAVGALAIVAAVVLPLSTVRRPAYASRCLSQMKGLGVGIAIYAGDADDRLPIVSTPVGATAVGWAARIAPYTKHESLFTDRLELQDLPESERERPHVSYALNANAASMPMAAIESEYAVRSVLLFEVANSRPGRDGTFAAALALSPAGDGAAGGLLDSIDPNVAPVVVPATGPLDGSGLDPETPARHKGRANFAFLDMHARQLDPTEVSAGANANSAKDAAAPSGGRRVDLPGVDRPRAEGAGGGKHPATFSLR